ncbi:MAG: hypothetical protein ACTSR8_00510 [Promethearchaeota archaeon]
MGLRKIEDEIDLRKAMEKKAAELRLKELQAKASVENLTKERLNEIAKSHGVILALNPKLMKEVEILQKKYNIPSSKIIKEEITENDVINKKGKIDISKLGLLAYQRVVMRKEETGGIMPLSEVQALLNTGELKGRIDGKELLKAMKLLLKNKMIDDIKELDTGAVMIHFFPIEFTSDQVKVIELAKQAGYITLENVCVQLEWSQDRALRALGSLEQSGIAKFRDNILKGKQWFFPSIE